MSVQETALKRDAFQRKQRALRDAMAIGDRLARRRQRLLLAAAFVAWRSRMRLMQAVSAKRMAVVAARMRHTLLHWSRSSRLRVRDPCWSTDRLAGIGM